jgi:hypothetical protein
MTVRLLLSVIEHLQSGQLVSSGVLSTLLELLTELPPLSLQNEPADVVDAFKSWLTHSVSGKDDRKQTNLSSAIECLFGLAVARGSLSDILSTMCLCIHDAPWRLSTSVGTTSNQISSPRLPFLNVSPFLKKLREWNIDLVLSPISRTSLSGTWTVRTPPIQHVPHVSSSSLCDSIATDGTYLFIHGSHGLCKIGTGMEGTVQGRTYISKPDFFPSERGWICCVANNLYFRSPSIAPATILVLDIVSLEVIGDVWQTGNGSLQTADNSHLPFGPEESAAPQHPSGANDSASMAMNSWRSPMFTDGRFIYLLSVVGFDYRFPKFSVDSYDPVNHFNHVSRVILHHKQSETMILFSPVLNPSLFATTSFYTNGQYLYALLPPSTHSYPESQVPKRSTGYDVPCFMLRKFRLSDGSLESDLVSDLVDSFLHAQNSLGAPKGTPLAAVYDYVRNSIWCSQFPSIARFTNAGIAPKFENVLNHTTFSPSSDTQRFSPLPEAGEVPSIRFLDLVAAVMSTLSRLSESSMPSSTANINALPASMRVNSAASRVSISTSTILNSFSATQLPLDGPVRQSYFIEPFCVEVSQDTFWLLFTIIKHCQDQLHSLLVDNFASMLDHYKRTADASSLRNDIPEHQSLSDTVSMIHLLLGIIDSGLSILAVNLQRLIAHALNPNDVGLYSSSIDAELADAEMVKNFSPSTSLISNLRRLLRYFVVVDDVYGFPLDNLTSLMELQDPLFDVQIESIQLKACKVLTVGLEVFYPSYSGQSMLLLNLLSRMDTSTERGPRRLLDSLISALAVHQNPSFLLLPPSADEDYYPTMLPKPLRTRDSEAPPAFAPLLAALIREAQASLHKLQQPSTPSPILALIQSIQKDLLARAEEAALNSPSAPALLALIEFVHVVLNQSVESFSRIMQSLDSSQLHASDGTSVNWWSMELMQEITTSVVGLLLPHLLQSLFFFAPNLLVGRSILPPIATLLEVVDLLHSKAPLPEMESDDSGSWNWTAPESQPTKSSYSKVVETLHPYEPGKTMKQTVIIPEATFLSLIFDERCSTLDPADCLELYEDEACHHKIHTQTTSFGGARSKWPRRRVIIPGNRVVFLFKSQTAMNPPKVASAKFSTSFETASTSSGTSSSLTTVPSKKTVLASWGFRCVVVGSNASMSGHQAAHPWSVHLEKTLCCLGGQISAALIRGDPESEEEKQFHTTWLDHPLFDGGLRPSSSSDAREDPLGDFLLSVINQSDNGVFLVRLINSMLPPSAPALETKLAAVRRAERATFAVILLHCGLGSLAGHAAAGLAHASPDLPPDFTSPQHPFSMCMQAIAPHLKKVRDSIIQRRQQQQIQSDSDIQISYRSIADPVVEKAMFLLLDVYPSLQRLPSEDASAMTALYRFGPRFEMISTIASSICSFILADGPIHSSLYRALSCRIRRASYRSEGFEAMLKLLHSVRDSQMRQEVLRFLSTTMQPNALPGDTTQEQPSGNNQPSWPHSYLGNLRGCGPMLATRVRFGFEKLYLLLADIMIHPDSSPALQLLAIEPWAMKFTAKDLPFLHEANLFQILNQIHFTAKASVYSLKEQKTKQTISKKGSSVMQSRSALTPDQLVKLNTELDLKTRLANSADSMFKLLALMCVAPGSVEIQSSGQSTQKSPPQTPVQAQSSESTPFHDAFFDIIYGQLSSAVEKAREETKHELAGTLKSAARLFELLDLLQFLHTLSSADVAKKHLSQVRFVRILLDMLLLRGDRALRSVAFKLFRRILIHPDADPFMMIDIESTPKPLVLTLLDIVGTIALWSSSVANSSVRVDPTLDTYSFARQMVTSTLLHSRTFERTVKKRALSRSVSGKLALTLPFCSFFSPALTFPVAWDSTDTPKHPSLEFSRDSRIAFVAGSTENEEAEDLHALAQRAVVIRSDHPIPDAVPFFYFEVRFEVLEDATRAFQDHMESTTPTDSVSTGSAVTPTPSAPKSTDGSLAVGLAAQGSPLYGLPGWYNNSMGYHSADGNKYRSSKDGRGERYGRKFTENDVIGCGWNRMTGTVFFTKNGALLGTAFRNINPSVPLLPVVGIISSSPRSAIVNFGQMPFLFDTSAMVRRTSALVKQVHSRLGVEATLLSLEITSLLRATMVPVNSPWRGALLAILKEHSAALPVLVASAVSHSTPSKDPLKPTTAAKDPIPPHREPLLRESSREIPKSDTILPSSSSEPEPHAEVDKQVEVDKVHVGLTSPVGDTPRGQAAPHDDSSDTCDSHKETLSVVELASLGRTLASMHVLGGDIEDVRVGGKVQASVGLNNDVGLVLEYRFTRPHRASVSFESQRKSTFNHDPKGPSELLVAKTTVPVSELTPLPEVVVPTDILQDALPALVPVVCRLFLSDHTPNSTSAILRHSIPYHRLKAASLKVLYTAAQRGVSICAMDDTFAMKLLEQLGQVPKDGKATPSGGSQVSASSHSSGQPSGGNPTNPPQPTASSQQASNLVPYQVAQSFNASMPLSSLPPRLCKVERISMNLHHRVFEANAPLELPRIYQELIDEDDTRVSRRSLDAHPPSSNSSSTESGSERTTMEGDDDNPALDSDSGYVADSSKRSRRSSQAVPLKSSSSASSTPNDAPLDLAPYGKPLRFSDIKLGFLLKLCLADKPRRPGDWQEDMWHLIGETGIVVDTDPKLQQVLLRFVLKPHALFEDWWVPHRLVVLSSSGTAYDEFFLLSMPHQAVERPEQSGASQPEPATPSVASSITSTLFAPFSSLLSSKESTSQLLGSGKLKEPTKEGKDSKELLRDTLPEPSSSTLVKDATNSAPISAPAHVSLASSREVWQAVPKGSESSSTGSVSPSKDESVLYLALYWEQQRASILSQLLFSVLFLNDPKCVSSVKIMSPLHLLHALRLVSASTADREAILKLLGTSSPFASFGVPLPVSSVGSVALLSHPPQPLEHRMFESKLFQLLKSDILEESSDDQSSSGSPTSLPHGATPSSAPHHDRLYSAPATPSISVVPPLDLPTKAVEVASPVSPSGKLIAPPVTLSQIDPCTVLNLPPSNLPVYLSEEPLRGFLTKMGKVFRHKKYWFVLSGPILSYYKNAQPNQPLVGSVDLRVLTGITGLEKRKKEHEFDLLWSDRSLSLQATTNEEKERWIGAITQHAQFYKLTSMPLTTKPVMTAVINECLLHLKDSVQPPLVLDTLALVQSASKSSSSSASKSSSHTKDKDQAFVHPLSQTNLPHSKSESPAASSSSVSQTGASATDKDKSGAAAPNPGNTSLPGTQTGIPLNALLVSSNVVGTPNSYAQMGNVAFVEYWLYPYAKRKMKKMVQLEWAESLLLEFDLACCTKSGLNVLRLYRDANCLDLIASFSGQGPACFPPLVIPSSNRFWMVFSCDANSGDSDILSPNTGFVNHKTEYGVKFSVSSYMTHLPASLLSRPSLEFGLTVVGWLLGLSDSFWVSQGSKEVLSYLAAHLEGPLLLDRRLRILTQLTRLLQRWKSLFDSNPPLNKLENTVVKTFLLYANHKRLGHQEMSLLFQKKFELAVQVVRFGDSLIAAQPPSSKESTTKETKDRSDSSSKEPYRRDPEAASAAPSSISLAIPTVGTYYYETLSTELNFLVPGPGATEPSPATTLLSDPHPASGATDSDKLTSSPRTVSFATSVQVKTAEEALVSDDESRSRLTISSEVVKDDVVNPTDSTDSSNSGTPSVRGKIVRNLSEGDTTAGEDGLSSENDEPSSALHSSGTGKDPSTKRVKKHRRSESSESEKKEKLKVERDKADKERERAEKEREKAEKERERLEKLEKERERLEREREREREKKKRKQAAKEAQLRAQSKTTKSVSSAAALTSIVVGPVWSQHRDMVQQQGRSAWLAQLSLTGTISAAGGPTMAQKAWFDQAQTTIGILERLHARRHAAQTKPPSTSAYPYNQYNDFTVDFAQESFLQARQQPVMMDSPHPYPHGVRVTSRVHCPKATQLLVYFDARSRTEANCDYLMFSKELIGGDDLGFFTGTSFPPSHEPFVIPGDSFVWSFLSDANGLVATQMYWGFRFTVTPVFTDDVKLDLAVKCEEEFRLGAAMDHLCTPTHDLQLMRFINVSVESLKVSSFELNPEQAFASLSNDPSAAASFPLLAALPIQALVRRFCYLKHLNTCMAKLIPLIDMSLHNESWSIAWLVNQSKHLLFYDQKLELLNTTLIASQTSLPKPVITINRQHAAIAEERSSESGPMNRQPKLPRLKLKSSTRSLAASSPATTPRLPKPAQPNANLDPSKQPGEGTLANGEFLFMQGFRNLHNVDPVRLRHSEKAWEVKFEGEGADDAGGPYRESLTQFCLDAQKAALGLFIPTENQKGKIGLNQDRFVPDPTATSVKQLAKFEFLGKLMGIAIRTKQPIDLSFPSIVWKSLLGAKLERSDLEGIDKQLVMFLEAIENSGSDTCQTKDDVPLDSCLASSTHGINLHALYAKKFTKATHQSFETSYSDAGISSTEEAVIQTHLALFSSSSRLHDHPYAYHRRNDPKESIRRTTESGTAGSSGSLSNALLDTGVTKEQFDQVFFETFRAARTRGNASPNSYVDLVPNGAQIPVTWNNRLLFASKLEQFRLTEFAVQLSAMATGMASIIPTATLSLFSWSELELRVCGRPGLDIALLQKNTVYHNGLSASSKLTKDFWKVLASLTAEEQMLFLRFVWGRSRLPSAQEFGSQRFHLQLMSKAQPFEAVGIDSSANPPPTSSSSSSSSAELTLISPLPTRTVPTLGTDSATRLMRLYYSHGSRVSDDDLQALLSTMHAVPSEASLHSPSPLSLDVRSAVSAATNSSRASPESKVTALTSVDSTHLPQSRTCFFQLSLPPYSNYSVLRAKLLYAITSCREIDTDFNPPTATSISQPPIAASAPGLVSSPSLHPSTHSADLDDSQALQPIEPL